MELDQQDHHNKELHLDRACACWEAFLVAYDTFVGKEFLADPHPFAVGLPQMEVDSHPVREGASQSPHQDSTLLVEEHCMDLSLVAVVKVVDGIGVPAVKVLPLFAMHHHLVRRGR